jgi:hypothetical protein
MKLVKVMILIILLIFLSQDFLVLAQEIIIENADSIWDSDLNVASSDVIDSTDAIPENRITFAFVSHADSIWNSDLIPATSDVTDSSDASPQTSIEFAFISHADSVWNTELTAAPSDITDSADTPTENLITWAFVSHADSFLKIGLDGEGWKPPTDKWSFAIITDLHIGFDIPDYDGAGYNENQAPLENYYLAERLKKVVERINYLKNIYNIKFVTVLGDISDTSEYSEMLKARKILDILNDPNRDGNTSDGIPYVPLIGNHDVWPYTQKPGIDPDVRGEENHATIANSAEGDGYFEQIFWADGDILKDGVVILKSTNPQKIKELFGNTWQRQEDDANFAGSPYLQNYTFKYGGINFISLDFVDVERNKTPGCISLRQTIEDTSEWLNNNVSKSTLLFSHYPKNQWKVGSLPSEVYSSFAGHVHQRSENDNTRPVEWWGSVITEATLEEYRDVIRIVQVKNVDNPTKEDIDYSKIEGISESIAPNSIKRPDPYVNYSPDNPDFGNGVEFTIRDEINGGKISSCEWDFGDGNVGNSSATECKISHKYIQSMPVLCEDFIIQATIRYNDNTQRIPDGKIIWVCPKFELKLPTPIIPFSIFGEEIISANTPQSVILTKVTSPGKPVGIINIHFEEAEGDINLSDLVADTNLETRKSVLYMPQWSEVIEEEKVLFIPYAENGTVYVCPEATSMEEINPRCPGKIILKLRETINDLTFSTTNYDDEEYYIVYGFTNGGGAVNLPPMADVNGSYQGDGGLQITLTASNSSDPNNDPLQYRWDFDDNGIWDTEWLETPIINHIWNNDYVGNIKLEVSDGEFTTSDTATVEVKSASWLKNEAITQLKSIQSTNKQTQDNINKATELIQGSLDSYLWTDASRLNSQQGQKVFDGEKNAVMKLLKITDPSILDKIKTIIDKITKADSILAKVAIYDAKNPLIQEPQPIPDLTFRKQVDPTIANAEKELAKAYQELKNNKPDKAIDQFKKAWQYAQLAIKFTSLK